MYSRASADRLIIALVIAAAIHLLVIFGLNFELPKPADGARPKSLAVTLVRSPARKAPKTAEFLADQNQFGSGASPKPPAPPEPPAPPKPLPPLALPPLQHLPAPVARPEPVPPRQAEPRPAEPHREKPAPKPARHSRKPPPEPTEDAVEDLTEHRPKPEPKPKAPKRRVLTQRQAEKKIDTGEGETRTEEPPPRRLTADLLSQQISEVSSDLSRYKETPTRGPRVTHINSVNAHQHSAAAYLQAWQEKVERIGNLNYPDEARRQQLSGSLVLTAVILPDGTLQEVTIDHSSGFPVLDEAAENIVRLAAPYAPFPAALRKTTDVLEITRTWRFYNDYRLEAD